MGQLHKARVNVSRPFQTTGIDFCGPFFVRPQPRARVLVKTYVCVYSCFATRATHLEVVEDLSTEGFLASLRRFVSRRGVPSEIYSDNGTNFIGGRNELAELRQLFLSEGHNNMLQQFCSNLKMKWKTIPARSPHWGGLWESTVKQFKYHFRTMTQNLVFNWPGLETLVCQIEAVLNSRPLSPMTSNAEDFAVLTPGHFLIGQPMTLLPEPSYSDVNCGRLKLWQERQKILNEVWNRIQKEYISELQKRAKWQTESPNLQPNALVLLYDENLPPCQWRMGRVTEIHPGDDGKVRSVTIKTSTGVTKRAVTRLAPLPIDD